MSADNYNELMLCGRLLLAAFLGALIGIERELKGRDAGIRTYASVALGSCLFGIISLHVSVGVIDTRIASNIVTGIGFIGAGMIIKNGDKISGLTTAATIWATSAIGLSIAFGMYLLGLLSMLIVLFLLGIQHFNWFQQLTKTIRKNKAWDEQKKNNLN